MPTPTPETSGEPRYGCVSFQYHSLLIIRCPNDVNVFRMCHKVSETGWSLERWRCSNLTSKEASLQLLVPPTSKPLGWRQEQRPEGRTRGAETTESRDLELKSPKYQVSEIPVGGSEFTSVGGPAWTETPGSPTSASRAPSCLGLPGAAAVPS